MAITRFKDLSSGDYFEFCFPTKQNGYFKVKVTETAYLDLKDSVVHILPEHGCEWTVSKSEVWTRKQGLRLLEDMGIDVDSWKEIANAPIVENEQGGKQSKLDVDFTRIDFDWLRNTAQVLTDAVERYPDNEDGTPNWTLIPFDDHVKHLLHHVISLAALSKQEGVSKEELIVHLTHISCRAMFAHHSIKTR